MRGTGARDLVVGLDVGGVHHDVRTVAVQQREHRRAVAYVGVRGPHRHDLVPIRGRGGDVPAEVAGPATGDEEPHHAQKTR